MMPEHSDARGGMFTWIYGEIYGAEYRIKEENHHP